MDSEGDLRTDLMAVEANPQGINIFGELPFTFINSSKNLLIPPKDSDTKRMTVLIPALFGDLNYASKFQSFSQIFAFNVKKQNWPAAPNAVHFVDAEAGTDKEPKIETVKPEVDIADVIQLAVTELALWLNTKGIKPGAMGQITMENAASAISKVVDEMDTVDLRQKQASNYSRKEGEFWDLVLHKMHPVWVSLGLVTNKHLLTVGVSVRVTFPPQKPMVDRGALVDTANKEIASGLKSAKTVREELNPDWDETRHTEEEKRIAEESTVTIDVETPAEETTEETEAQGTAHTHTSEAGTIGPVSNSDGTNHGHDEGWSITPFGAGHTHTKDGEVSGPPI